MIADRRTTANPFDSQDFRDEFKKTMGETLKPITDILEKHENTITAQGVQLADHEGKFKTQKGGLAVLVFLGGLLETVLHWRPGSH